MRTLLLALTFALSGISCSDGGEATAQPEDDGTVRVLIGHAVEDFDTWRERFAGHEAARIDAGISGEWVLRGVENPNLVFLLAETSSEDAANAFVSDPNLARSMQFSGVEGAVVNEILASGISYAGADSLEQLLLVRHPVRNFERWKNTFEGHRRERAEVGVHELLVTHPVDDPNDVYMMFGVTDVETVTDYMASDILRIAMRLAGVTGEPQAYFVERVP